jgi:hypothetical protein
LKEFSLLTREGGIRPDATHIIYQLPSPWMSGSPPPPPAVAGLFDKVTGWGTSFHTWGSLLLSGGLCRGAEFWGCLPWALFSFVCGVVATILLLGCCAVCGGGRYYFYRKRNKIQERRKVRRRHSSSIEGETEEDEEEERKGVGAVLNDPWENINPEVPALVNLSVRKKRS